MAKLANQMHEMKSCHLQVGYLLHNTGYRNNETFLSNREKQYITMETAGLYNTQELRIHLNWSAIDDDNPSTFTIEWAGRTSRPIAVNNITTISSELHNCYHGCSIYCMPLYTS